MSIIELGPQSLDTTSKLFSIKLLTLSCLVKIFLCHLVLIIM